MGHQQAVQTVLQLVATRPSCCRVATSHTEAVSTSLTHHAPKTGTREANDLHLQGQLVHSLLRFCGTPTHLLYMSRCKACLHTAALLRVYCSLHLAVGTVSAGTSCRCWTCARLEVCNMMVLKQAAGCQTGAQRRLITDKSILGLKVRATRLAQK